MGNQAIAGPASPCQTAERQSGQEVDRDPERDPLLFDAAMAGEARIGQSPVEQHPSGSPHFQQRPPLKYGPRPITIEGFGPVTLTLKTCLGSSNSSQAPSRVTVIS